MKQQYIKIIDKTSYKEACKIVEELGYERDEETYRYYYGIDIKYDYIQCREDGIYAPYTERFYPPEGEEIKIDNILIPGMQVAVSNVSEKQAIKDLEDDDYKFYYICKIKNGKYAVENNKELIDSYKYCVPAPVPEVKSEFKIGDKVVFDKDGVQRYIIIYEKIIEESIRGISITYNDDILDINYYRKPTQGELDLHFN